MRDPFDVSRRERVAVLGTVVGSMLCALLVGLLYAHDATVELVGLIPASIVAVGKFLPLWGIGGRSHFNPWELGLVIWVLDTLTVLIVVYGLELFYRFPALKRILAKVQGNASLVLAAYPGIRRAAVVGVVLFVLFPVAGTGALVGAFLGILLGLNRLVLVSSVSFGGLLGGMLMAFAAVNFSDAVERLRQVQSDPTVKWVTIAVVVMVIGGAFMWLNRIYKRALDAARAEINASS